MRFIFAPMEGVTAFPFRRLHAELFPGADTYYAPFLAPDGSGRCRAGRLRDILPENNQGLQLIPQILCGKAEPFLILSRELAAMGYREVNLNAGCPSATVVPKHKGAGLLLDLSALDDFLAEVFSHCPMEISVKTRLGITSPAEFPAILEIYNKYPIVELTIHARDRAGMYRSQPDLAAFAAAVQCSRNPVCYNGNIFAPSDLAAVQAQIPDLGSVMAGRGAAANPALFRQLRGGPALEAGELRDFLFRLESAYLAAGYSEQGTLARLKELWYYMIHMFPESGRSINRLNKAQSLSDYEIAVRALFAGNCFSPSAAFVG